MSRVRTDIGDRHGTNGYTNYGCRCDVCRTAGVAAMGKRRRQRVAYTCAYGLPETVAHGASAYSNWGCRCDVCRAGWAEYARSRAES